MSTPRIRRTSLAPPSLARTISSSKSSLIVAIKTPKADLELPLSASVRLAKRKRPSYFESESEAEEPKDDESSSKLRQKKRLSRLSFMKQRPISGSKVHEAVDIERADSPQSADGNTGAPMSSRKSRGTRSPQMHDRLNDSVIPTDPVTATFELHKRLKTLLSPYAGPLELDLSKLTDGLLELLRTCSSIEISQQQERDVAALQQLVAAQGASIWAEVTSLQNQCRKQHEELRALHQEGLSIVMARVDGLHSLWSQRGTRESLPTSAVMSFERNRQEQASASQPTIDSTKSSGAKLFNRGAKSWNTAFEHQPSGKTAMHESSKFAHQHVARRINPEKHTSIAGSAIATVVDNVRRVGKHVLSDVFHLKGLATLIFEDDGAKTSDLPLESPIPAQTGYMLRSRTSAKAK